MLRVPQSQHNQAMGVGSGWNGACVSNILASFIALLYK